MIIFRSTRRDGTDNAANRRATVAAGYLPVFFALAALKKSPQVGELVLPTPHLRIAVCPAMPYDDDRRFRGVVDAWTEDNRGIDQIRRWIMAELASLGIGEGDLPPDLTF